MGVLRFERRPKAPPPSAPPEITVKAYMISIADPDGESIIEGPVFYKATDEAQAYEAMIAMVKLNRGPVVIELIEVGIDGWVDEFEGDPADGKPSTHQGRRARRSATGGEDAGAGGACAATDCRLWPHGARAGESA